MIPGGAVASLRPRDVSLFADKVGLTAALTPLDPVRIFHCRGDVAELADAQVSEACDGDIVEVQVLSSPPTSLRKSG